MPADVQRRESLVAFEAQGNLRADEWDEAKARAGTERTP